MAKSKAQRQNANVRVGTIRKGTAGNKYNKWNGTRWVPVAAARTVSAAAKKPSVASKPVPASSKPKPRVAGSVAAKQARQKPAGRRVSKVDVAEYRVKKKVRETSRGVSAAASSASQQASRVPSAAKRILENLWYQ